MAAGREGSNLKKRKESTTMKRMPLKNAAALAVLALPIGMAAPVPAQKITEIDFKKAKKTVTNAMPRRAANIPLAALSG